MPEPGRGSKEQEMRHGVQFAIVVFALVAIAAAIAVPMALVGARPTDKAASPRRTETVSSIGGSPATPVTDFGGNGPNLWATTPDGDLYLSTDGGTSWTKALTPVPVVAARQMPSEPVQRYGVAPYGVTVFGATVWLVTPTHGRDVLFESHDGGERWSAPRPVPGAASGSGGTQISVQLLNTHDGFVAVEPRASAKAGALDGSTDGGAKLFTRRLPARGIVHFDSTTVGFLVTVTGRRIYETTDAGASWRPLTAKPTGPEASDYRIGFPLGVTSSWVVVPVTVTKSGTGSLYTMAAEPGRAARALGHLVGTRGYGVVVADTSSRAFSGSGRVSYSFHPGWTSWTTLTARGALVPAGWVVSTAMGTLTGSWVVSEVHRSCSHTGACSYAQVLYTAAGTAWQPIVLGEAPLHPSGTGVPRLQTMAFLSPTTGYGAFTGGVYDCTVRVAETIDGGARYTSPVQVGSCTLIGQAGTLTFDERGDGFVYSENSPLLYETHDGGATWSSELQAGDVLSVKVVGSSVWLLVADCAPTQGSITGTTTCPLTVRQSTDGGHTWHTSPAQPQRVPPPSRRIRQEASMVRLGRSTAYVLGTPDANGHAKPATVPLWFTDDAGRSWTLRHVECGMDATTARISAAPTGTLFAACAGQPGLGLQPKSVVVSTNDGISWSHPGKCTTSLGGCTTAGVTGGYLGEIDAVSSRAAYFTGNRSGLYETTDAAATWKSAIGPTDGVGGPAAVAFTNADDGVALAATLLWHTSDGGATWTQVTPVLQR